MPSSADAPRALPPPLPVAAEATADDPLAAEAAAPATPPPFDFYTGDESTAGDYFVRVERWRHPESGRQVTLLPMVHLADAEFFAAVEGRLLAADVVLTEGVGGAPALSPTTLLLAYVFGNYSRACWLGDLSLQADALDEGPRARGGDLDIAEFSDAMGCGAPLLHAAALPVLMVLVEPLHFGRWLWTGARDLTGGATEDAASFRHWLVSDLADTEGDEVESDGLLPGIIDRRNTHLLDQLDRAFTAADVGHVALPWGASHMPGLAAGLVERGYERADAEWLCAIAVRGRLDGSKPAAVRTHLCLPYVIDWRSDRRGGGLGLLCDAIAVRKSAPRDAEDRGPVGVELLWGLLATCEIGRDQGQSSFSLLPQLFARPLLFEWRRRGDSHRFRFLWFFEVGA
ncbi:MAG: hypothetical protein FJ293_09975 [Planctomycetes bacterium]|nr:hypothetical protein [Planctomycetota bacterium]